MGAEVHGDVDDGYGAVADEFRRNFAERKELGAACAVVRDGKLVVDVWGGYRDKQRTKLWQRLATEWKPMKVGAAVKIIKLDQLPDVFRNLLDGRMTGRYVVEIAGSR